MILVEEAIKLVCDNVEPIKLTENRNVKEASEFILSRDIFSPINMPPFNQSAMDGYAVSLHSDLSYTVIDEVKAGDGHHPILNTGDAVRIFTGGPVPDTANAVVIQEKVALNKNMITLEDQIPLGANIRLLGEQVEKDVLALEKGTKLTPAAIGFLATLGITEVQVFTKPKIAIVVTGNELIEASTPLTYGKIYESNGIMLLSALNNNGYDHVSIYKVTDNYKKTVDKLNKVIAQNDMVIISGGISVGDYDFVGKALNELNVDQIFYKVKQKPGKPLFFGTKKNTKIFALPGNPASALSCFYVYVYPALQSLSGNSDLYLTKISANSTSDFIKKGDRSQFLKAFLKNGKVTILEGQSSAMLKTFSIANALVYIPEHLMNISKGDLVEVILLPV